MPWRPSKRSRAEAPTAVAGALARLSLAVALLAAGCAGTVERGGGAVGVAAGERVWLPSPLEGYPLVMPAGATESLRVGWSDLLETADLEMARAVAGRLLAADPGLHPATVLAAEADLLEGDAEAVVARLGPVVQELPTYLAAQLVLGRASELADDLPGAVEAYLAVADGVPAAAARAAELTPRALEILGNRVEDAVARGRLEDAERSLESMRLWGAGEISTLAAEASLAAAVGEFERELAAIRALVELEGGTEGGDRARLERLAELEVETGEPTAGLRILQELVDRHPEDAGLADRLARARFGWRLQLLPDAALARRDLPRLDRGDFATLLYWLFPNVRYGRSESGRIATDVFGHPDREQIVRVANLGLMTVDPNLHRFEPERPVSRFEVLWSLVTLLDRGSERPACLGAGGAPGRSVAAVCQLAVRCDLVVEPDACLPAAEVSGGEAVELARRALEALGVQ